MLDWLRRWNEKTRAEWIALYLNRDFSWDSSPKEITYKNKRRWAVFISNHLDTRAYLKEKGEWIVAEETHG